MEPKETTLSDLMLVHHGLLEVLFKSLKDNIGLNTKTEFLQDMLNEFQWELEKHFFVEEKVIFNFCTATEPQICSIVVGLLNEHKRMTDMLEDLKKKLPNKFSAELLNFEILLKSHRMVEEEKLYPRLDEELNEEDKNLIISRINELPVKKAY